MTTRLNKILGFNLKREMKYGDISQSFLAKRIKKVPMTVYNYLHDKTLPDLKTVNKIRAEFGLEALKELPVLRQKKAQVKVSKTGKRTWKVEKPAGMSVKKVKEAVLFERDKSKKKKPKASKKPKNEVTIELQPATI